MNSDYSNNSINAKVQNFKKQIRRQQLNEYFRKRRKQFSNYVQANNKNDIMNNMNITNSLHKIIQQSSTQHTTSLNIPTTCQPYTSQNFTIDSLSKLYQLTQTQFGISLILKTQIPKNLLLYLFPKYFNTKYQHLTTCIYANITYIKPQKIPSKQFMNSIYNILINTALGNDEEIQQKQLEYSNNHNNNTNNHHNNNHNNNTTNNNNNIQQSQKHTNALQTIQNCLLIIYNLIVQYEQVIQYYVQSDILQILYSILDTSVTKIIVEKVFKILNAVMKYYLGKYVAGSNNNEISYKNIDSSYNGQYNNSNNGSNNFNNKVFKKFLKFYISVFQNIQQQSLIFLSLSNIKLLLQIYQTSIKRLTSLHNNNNNNNSSQLQQQFHSIQSQIQKSRLLNKILSIYPVIKNNYLILNQILVIDYYLVTGISVNTIKEKIIKLLIRIYKDSLIINHPNNNTKQFNHPDNNPNNNIKQLTTPSQYKKSQLKSHFYSLIYHILLKHNTQHSLIITSQLYSSLFFHLEHLFQLQQQKQIHKYFVYIFGLLVFSGELSTGKSKIILIEIINKLELEEYFQYDHSWVKFINNLKEFVEIQ